MSNESPLVTQVDPHTGLRDRQLFLQPAQPGRIETFRAAAATGATFALPQGHTLEMQRVAPDRFRARIYRAVPEGTKLASRWHWHCLGCDMGSSTGCLHTVLHEPGTWRAAMCAGFHHIHRRHPRSALQLGVDLHTTMFGRRRCNWSLPNESQQRLAGWLLNGSLRMSYSAEAHEFAREILALAGVKAP